MLQCFESFDFSLVQSFKAKMPALLHLAVQLCGYACRNWYKPSKYATKPQKRLEFRRASRVLLYADRVGRFCRFFEPARLYYETQIVDTVLVEEAFIQLQ